MTEREDTRTLGDLAKEALAVQDACNLSGVVHGFSRSISRLRVLLNAEPGFSTGKLNEHPVCQLWASKVASLAGVDALADNEAFRIAYGSVSDLAAR